MNVKVTGNNEVFKIKHTTPQESWWTPPARDITRLQTRTLSCSMALACSPLIAPTGSV
jgi:hypothetical protein